MMNNNDLITKSIQDSIDIKKLVANECINDIERCGNILSDVYKNGKKVLFCGNGGSAADAQHIATELVIRYRSTVERRSLPAIALTTDSSMATAGGNDFGFENTFARMVEGLGNTGDVLVGISTSGNSVNVINAVKMAKSKGVHTIGLLGNNGGHLLELTDANVVVPSVVTARIQECHIMIGHIWCEMIEMALFPEFFSKDDK